MSGILTNKKSCRHCDLNPWPFDLRALDSVVRWPMFEFNLLLSQPMFAPFEVASTLGDLAAAAIASVLFNSKKTQSLYILKD